MMIQTCVLSKHFFNELNDHALLPSRQFTYLTDDKDMVLIEKNIIWERQCNGFPTFKVSNKETGDGIITCDFNCII